MTPVTVFRDRHVALFGLGGSGLASALALVAGGAHVAAWDDTAAACAKAEAAGVPVENLRAADWSRFQTLVLAPGVPLTHPTPHWAVEKARAAGIEIIGDIELFCRERAAIAPQARFIAITGTNGKSTTTALVAHLVSSFGHDVFVGGNIGTPILALAPPAGNRVHVVECSSYQIDLAPSLNASVGILLNVTPDHLDRHGSMENYAAIKARLVARADHAVVGLDDGATAAIARRLIESGHNVTCVSTTHRDIADGIVFEGTSLVRRVAGHSTPIADLEGIAALRGAHNGQNAAAAVAALESEGFDIARVTAGLKSFPGLAHRLEDVGYAGNVLFINDSKATNADAAEKALLAFDRVYWIIGGVAKAGGIEPLRPLFGKVAKAYLVGQAADAFAATLGTAVPFTRCGTLQVAVAHAAADAAASGEAAPVVLFSPACASFDQYPNFERRGDHFRDIVKALLRTEKINN